MPPRTRARLAVLAAVVALMASTAIAVVAAPPASASGGAPIAVGDSYGAPDDRKLEVPAPGVLANDTDPDGDALRAELDQPGGGYGRVDLRADGSLTYRALPGHPGYDYFSYRVFDGTSWSSPNYVYIGIYGAPVGQPESYSSVGSRWIRVAAPGLMENDTGLPGSWTKLSERPVHGKLYFFGRDGSFEYRAFAGYSGPDQFVYRVYDPLGRRSRAITVTLRVRALNQPPVAVADHYEVVEDSGISELAPGLAGNDLDGDGDALTVEVTSWPAEGWLEVDAHGGFSYSTDTDQDNDVTFRYRVSDGYTWSAPVEVSIDVKADNDPPSAEPDSYNGYQDETLTVNSPGVLENDADLVEFDGAVVWRLVTGPAHGTLDLRANGSFTYIPDPGFWGSDGFVYQVGDFEPGGTTYVELYIEPVG